MRFNVDAEALRRALEGNLAGNGTLPILSHVLVDAGEGAVSLTTSDMALWLTALVPAGVEAEGRVAVDAAALKAALYGLVGNVVFDYSGDKQPIVTVQAGRRRFKPWALHAIDFPAHDEDLCTPLEVDPVALARAIGVAQYAAARSDVRRYLECVCLSAGVVVATDGHRLATAPVEIGLEEGEELMLPTASIKHVLRILGEGAVLHKVSRAGGGDVALRIACGGRDLRVALLDGKYPSWRQVIPKGECQAQAAFRPSDAAAALKRISPFSQSFTKDGKKCGHNIDVTFGDGEMRISPFKDKDITDFVPCVLTGSHDGIAIEQRYLSDILATAGDDEITWHLYGADACQAFSIEGRDDRHYLMPLRR